MSIARTASAPEVRVDHSKRAVTNFQVGDVLYRMTPGALDPVTRYYVTRVLAQDTYRVQVFDQSGELITRPIVVTPDRAREFHFDSMGTRFMGFYMQSKKNGHEQL